MTTNELASVQSEPTVYTTPGSRNPNRNARLSIWMLLVSEAMLFFGLLSSFFFLRMALPSWGPPHGRAFDLTLPLLNSLLLFGSAGTLHLAYRAIQHDQQRRFVRLLTLTMLLGAAFILGQIFEFSTLGFAFQDGAYAAIFLLTIGTHAAHVAVGVLIFVVVHIRASLELYSARQHLGVELCALYWYFVALMWVVIFPIVYFV